MPRRRLLPLSIAALVACLVGIWGGLAAVAHFGGRALNAGRGAVTPVIADPGGPLPILWDAPAFAFADQDGRPFTSLDLAGHPYVADFVFTTCRTACPTMTAHMVLLQKRLPQPGLRFVSFSVDPAHDAPAVLKRYAADWRGDPARWTLLATDPAGLGQVAAGFKVAVLPSDDPDSPIAHSSLFTLVDGGGHVRGVYDSGDQTALNRLADDADRLTGAAATAAVSTGELMTSTDGDAARGGRVYAAMGCMACHSQPKLAPPLADLYGGRVRLDDGRTVWADDAYLHESIVDPNAKGVAGYLRSMPSYRDYLDDGQVTDLVAYVRSLSRNPPPPGHGVVAGATAAANAPAVVVDPVCHMKVVADPTGPRATVAGRAFYFCSDRCRERFAAAPGKYTSAPATQP